MNYTRIAIAAVAATIFYYIYGFLVEGLLIRKDFLPYTAVYRSGDAVKPLFPLGILCTLVASFVIGMIYAKGYEGGSGVAEGSRFGLLVAVFVVCTFVGPNFVILNIGGRLALKLAVSNLVQWTLLCIIIGLIYRPAATAVR